MYMLTNFLNLNSNGPLLAYIFSYTPGLIINTLSWVILLAFIKKFSLKIILSLITVSIFSVVIYNLSIADPFFVWLENFTSLLSRSEFAALSYWLITIKFLLTSIVYSFFVYLINKEEISFKQAYLLCVFPWFINLILLTLFSSFISNFYSFFVSLFYKY
jgi:hypothetical protein